MQSRLAALEALAFSPRADASHANLAAELHVLAAASLSENDVAEMLRRLEGRARQRLRPRPPPGQVQPVHAAHRRETLRNRLSWHPAERWA